MVLVVDDDATLCHLMLRILKLSRIAGHCENGGREALGWLAEHRPELIILDLSMPDVSGVEVLRKIKTNPALSDIPVVLHSALAEPVIESLAKDNGADGVLLKGRYGIQEVAALLDTFSITSSGRDA